VGGLDVKVLRTRYGTQIQSFVAELDLPFLGDGEKPFRGVFIRAPVVEEIMSHSEAEENGHVVEPVANGNSNKSTEPVQVLGVFRKPGATGEPDEDVVAVRQRNVFGTSFHPELTDDIRIHTWWLRQVLAALRHGDLVVSNTE
jgi:5'-phosphate synthase pdxT subunit